MGLMADAKTIAKRLNISEAEAQQMIDSSNESMSAMKNYFVKQGQGILSSTKKAIGKAVDTGETAITNPSQALKNIFVASPEYKEKRRKDLMNYISSMKGIK